MNQNKAKKIGWVQIRSRKYGGKVYESQAQEILAKNFDFEMVNVDTKYFKKGYFKIPELIFNLSRIKGEKDLWIRDLNSLTVLNSQKTRGKNLAIVHHIDFSQSSSLSKPINLLIEKNIYRNLKKADAILTVSQYWKNHFLKLGHSKVFTIYNAFDFEEFNISDEEVSDFKKRYNLGEKPILYIGNCQKAKGVLETYEALKDLDVNLITSGEQFLKIPAQNLEVSHADYLKLLKASAVVITMSKFKEGWCRTAHEAMLLKTPVIGSGLGGMRELLEGGGQIVCPRFNLLKAKVEYLLNSPEKRKEIGEGGYNFAKKFTLERFEKEWLEMINRLI